MKRTLLELLYSAGRHHDGRRDEEADIGGSEPAGAAAGHVAAAFEDGGPRVHVSHHTAGWIQGGLAHPMVHGSRNYNLQRLCTHSHMTNQPFRQNA